jgi:hydrogenase maturation factor HypE
MNNLTENNKKRDKMVKRVQLDLPPRSLDRLMALRDKTEASSYAEVIRNALQLYEALIEEVDKGNEVCIRRDGQVSSLMVFGS